MTPERKKELRAFYWNPGEVQTIVDELLDEIERLERIVDAETIADLEAENARLRGLLREAVDWVGYASGTASESVTSGIRARIDAALASGGEEG